MVMNTRDTSNAMPKHISEKSSFVFTIIEMLGGKGLILLLLFAIPPVAVLAGNYILVQQLVGPLYTIAEKVSNLAETQNESLREIRTLKENTSETQTYIIRHLPSRS